MKRGTLATILVILSAAMALQAAAEVVYTQVNAPVPLNGFYNIDLNHDGIVDYTLRSSYLEGWCQFGDQYSWSLQVLTGNGDSVVTTTGHINAGYAAALQAGVVVSATQSFYNGASVMADLYWGGCGRGSDGPWLNVSDRYLGFQMRAADGTLRYGWARIATAAYIDQLGYLHTATMLTGFAYQTVAGQPIAAGQTVD